jgi:hypothetical protein
MTLTRHDPAGTMLAARAVYFAVNQFGDDGGYDDAWVTVKLGPVPVSFPNVAGRVRAVRYHDLHHIITEYDTDIIGEFEIAAWELGSGCKDFWAAWFLNLGSLTGGLLSAPRRTFRAFVRGRGSRTLYGEDLEALLASTVATVRARMGPALTVQPPARPADVALFAGMAAVGGVFGSVVVALGVVAAPVVLAWTAWRRRSTGADGRPPAASPPA